MTSTLLPIRVLLVDPDDIDRAGLRCLLHNQPGIEVVAEAAEVTEAAAAANDVRPDVMLVDSDALPPAGEAAQWLSALPPSTRLLLLCREDEPDRISPLVGQGVMGIVLKRHGADAVTKAITKVHAGEPWMARSTMARLLGARSRERSEVGNGMCERLALLSQRERQIMDLVAKGQKNRKIAETLEIREATVRNHLSSIFRKLHVSDRLELAVFAHRHGLRHTH